MADNKLVEIKDLKTYFYMDQGLVRAVDGVTFDIMRGKTLGVVGESGCGKSVTGFSIMRLVQKPGRIVGGSILYHQLSQDGKSEELIDIAKLKPESREVHAFRGGEIGMVFQEPMTSLDPVYTVGNQLEEAIFSHRKATKSEAKGLILDMLKRVRLANPERLYETYPYQLSGGMRQRIMIAMGLLTRPALLIADEPTTALDVTTEAQILDLLRDLQSELGMSILYITHNLGVVAEMVESAIVMYLGKVVEKADVIPLFEEPKHPYLQALLRSIPKVGQKSGDHLASIRGMVPNPLNIPPGCPFHPRCPRAMRGLCNVKMPAETDLGGGHMVRCFLFNDAAE
jgi:oligopeptide/dipeptide ABC transporter ATP-binding protein